MRNEDKSATERESSKRVREKKGAERGWKKVDEGQGCGSRANLGEGRIGRRKKKEMILNVNNRTGKVASANRGRQVKDG